MQNFKTLAIVVFLTAIMASCQKNSLIPGSDSTNAVSETAARTLAPGFSGYPEFWIDPKNFVVGINNQYFPLTPGDTFFYQNVVDDTVVEDIYVTTTHDVKVVEGISCEVIHDVVTTKGTLTEDTYDYYAQDINGDVWYFGEDTKSLQEDGTFSTAGSFTAGVDGAKAGVTMLSNPSANIGQTYRQEWLPGQAEDQAKVISTNETVTIGLGTYNNCLHTQEITMLEKGVVENKWYAPGIGQILTTVTQGGNEREELIGTNK
ncbi:MAG: hypothetical protein H0W62_00790 [Chitinophagales bacterium]|nr:hypothetical protein [Chitinophagales bacterium]